MTEVERSERLRWWYAPILSGEDALAIVRRNRMSDRDVEDWCACYRQARGREEIHSPAQYLITILNQHANPRGSVRWFQRPRKDVKSDALSSAGKHDGEPAYSRPYVPKKEVVGGIRFDQWGGRAAAMQAARRHSKSGPNPCGFIVGRALFSGDASPDAEGG